MLDKVKRIVELKKQMEELDTQLKALKQAYDDLEPQVIEYMEKEGLQRLTVDDRTVYVNRQIWASVSKSNPEALEILRENGLDDFIEEKVNSQRISAFVREFEKNGEDIPDWCHDALNITEKYTVGMRKIN
jgi:3-methyladenine DNA glycosylase Tag